jgi:signal transduction histidine kinase
VIADADLLRRTGRRLAAQVAILIAAAIIVVTVVAGALVVRTQNGDAQHRLELAISDRDSANDPPSGIVVYREERGRTEASAGLTAPLDAAALDKVRAGRDSMTTEADWRGREYLVRTERRGSAVVQVGLDLTEQRREQVRLAEGLAAAALAGLLLALGMGWLMGRRAVRPIADAFERQRQFVADASHELRTPLTQVHTRAQLLRRSIKALPEAAGLTDDADRLVRGTRLLGEIVDDLLVSAQMRRVPGEGEPVDLRAIAEEVVESEATRAERRTLSVDADDGPHSVNGSATALRRVLNSLVDNAIGHTADDGTVTVRLRRLHSRVDVSVIDNGVGFEPGESERLFERFARGDHGSGRRFGLGLALVRDIVEAHHGTVRAEGEPGGGATFTVNLPAGT